MVSVIVPTRFTRLGFIADTLQSIREQGINHEILVGIDRDAVVPEGFAERFGVAICRGAENSQAAALNAGLACARGEYVAFLEDDDRWLPEFLKTAISLKAPFVSSTQLEVDLEGVVLRINDFPTPSGWVVKRDVFNRLGAVVGSLHLDNYILGRVGEEGIERVHLVEATAPVQFEYADRSRPFLAAVLSEGQPRLTLYRHANPYPLVVRRVHADSGSWRAIKDPTEKYSSDVELAALVKRFGRIPW